MQDFLCFCVKLERNMDSTSLMNSAIYSFCSKKVLPDNKPIY